MKWLSSCFSALKVSSICFIFLIPQQLFSSNDFNAKPAQGTENSMSENIEIYFYPRFSAFLLKDISIYLNDIDYTNSTDVFDKPKRKIKINRKTFKDRVKVKIVYKDYPTMEFELYPNMIEFERINIYYSKEIDDDSRQLITIAGYVKKGKRKKRNYLIYLNSDDKKTKTDGLNRDYEENISKTDEFNFYTKKKKDKDTDGNTILAPDPATLIKFFNLQSNIRLDVVLDDGNKDVETPPSKKTIK